MSKIFYQALGKQTQWPNLPGNIAPTSITYADVNLVPQNTEISSRKEIDTSVQFGPYTLSIPFVGSPMDTVMGERMIRELDRLGAIGTLPRPSKGFEEENVKIAKKLIKMCLCCGA